MNLPFFQVDAFTREPGKGNPSGVYLLPEQSLQQDGMTESEHLHLLALSTNLLETGFVRRRHDGFSLRWFTPKTELELCGHGTVGAAHVLWEQGWLAPGESIRFHTRSGQLTVHQLKDGWIELDFPAFKIAPADLPGSILSTFPKAPKEMLFAHDRHIVVLESEAEVRNYQPDFATLKDHRLVITARADDRRQALSQELRYDFVSRYFGVPLGVNEDPVTGSAHCGLSPYWAPILGKTSMMAYQASARGGYLKVRLEGERVFIAGQAITVSKQLKNDKSPYVLA